MPADLWTLYALMLKSRLFEEGIAGLWHDGLISGEMHLGTGEEAIIAGIVSQLEKDDAMALDHRGTAAMLMRGVGPVLILRELLGCEDGLCGGMGGHMHLFSKDHLAASSGIVGAEGPAAAGFALSAKYLRPGSIAVAFFGDGAMNQGMLLESMNLASVWNLPVLFVCKDDGWAITTQKKKVTAGNISERAQSLGIPATDVNGCDIEETWEAARAAIERIRSGQGPEFMHARCVHFEGHFLGFQLIRIARNPVKEMPGIAVPVTQSFLRPGGSQLKERLAGLRDIFSAVFSTLRDPRRDSDNDPVQLARKILSSDKPRLNKLEEQIKEDINSIFESSLQAIKS